MTHYQLAASNNRKSLLIVGLFIAFITGAVYLMVTGLGYDSSIVWIALIVSGLISFGSFWFSDKIILSISHARPATRQEFFDFYTITENICLGQRLPMPKLYVIDDIAMNAFSTGRDPEHAALCATTGILSKMNREELEAVIGHELGHIRNYDIRLMGIIAILVGMIALLADWFTRMTFWGGGRKRNRDDNEGGGQLQMVFFVIGLILALLSPIIAQLMQLAISRRREYLADATSVELTKNPQGMISALEKLETETHPLVEANKATAALYITNPLINTQGAAKMFANLFNTHPPLEDRIAALKNL